MPTVALVAIFGCMGGSHWPPAVSTKAQIEKLPESQQDIRGIAIRDQELQLIATRFSHLDYLFVSSYAEISDEGVSHLSRLSKLRQVVFEDGSHLSDRSVQVFAGLPCLRELMVTNAPQLTDTSLELLGNKKEMKLLYLSKCSKISDPAKAALKKSLPGCKITIE